MTDYSDYFEEVIQAHVAIEQWFNGTATDDALELLLEGRYTHWFMREEVLRSDTCPAPGQ